MDGVGPRKAVAMAGGRSTHATGSGRCQTAPCQPVSLHLFGMMTRLLVANATYLTPLLASKVSRCFEPAPAVVRGLVQGLV